MCTFLNKGSRLQQEITQMKKKKQKNNHPSTLSWNIALLTYFTQRAICLNNESCTHLKKWAFVSVDLMNGSEWNPYYGDQWDSPAHAFSPHRVLILPIVSRSVLDNAGGQYALWRGEKDSLITIFTHLLTIFTYLFYRVCCLEHKYIIYCIVDYYLYWTDVMQWNMNHQVLCW